MKHKPKTLTPKLRFPEFNDGLRWEEKPFRAMYAFKPTNTLSRDKLNYEAGTIRNIHYGDIHTRFRTLFDITREVVPFVANGSMDDFAGNAFCAEGDLIFADASEDLNDVGKSIEVVSLKGESVVSGTHTILATRRDAQLIVGFGGYLFRSERMRQQIRKESQGSKVYGLSSGRLENVKVCFPAKADEQRKIAACLTSLDEWVAAERRKLEALRAHKKGLMQQLFPREGETRPRLRFPEFREAPEWEETSLGQLGRLVSGLTYSPADVRSEGLLVLRSSNIQGSEIAMDDCVYVTPGIRGANLAQPNDILICVRNGSKPLIGKNALIPDGMPPCTHGAFMTVLRAKAPQFVFQLLQTGAYHKQIAANLGATINSINGSQLLKYRFVAPEQDEQQRIATCLSSLDALIAAQSRKLDGLRAHKKGLMQRLFPSPENAEE
jgi:type I restriction enzyme S subunit